MGIRKYLKLNSNENTMRWSLQGEATTVLRGKFITLKIFYKKKKGPKINKCHVKKLEQNKPIEAGGRNNENYIYWITNPKAGSGVVIEIESAICNIQDMETTKCPSADEWRRKLWDTHRNIIQP